METTMDLNWLDAQTFRVGGADFRLKVAPEFDVSELRHDFWILKLESHLDRYVSMAEEFSGARIFELGIKDGGSTALFAELYQPEKMVSIDLTSARLEHLDSFLERRDLAQRVLPHFGVDQADSAALIALVDEHMDGPLDLVIDDASHYPDETRITFNTLFPRLRPGGVFVLEDWSANLAFERAFAQLDADRWAEVLAKSAAAPPTPPKSASAGFERFVLELVLASGSSPDVVAEVAVSRGIAVVRRGSIELDPDGFDIADHNFGVAASLLVEE